MRKSAPNPFLRQVHRRTAFPASDGRFSLTLAPGRYRVTIARDSFAAAEQEITIAAGETRELQVRLALEPLSSKVVVTAQALPLDADSSPAPLTILTREQIDQRVATSLPDLLATQPGFSLGRTGPEGGHGVAVPGRRQLQLHQGAGGRRAGESARAASSISPISRSTTSTKLKSSTARKARSTVRTRWMA